MSETPVKKQKRRATILVTGPQSKKTIFDGEDIKEEEEGAGKSQLTLQDLTLARQRLHNELAVVNTASGIEILVQIFMDELEIIRYRLRENGLRMRNFFSDGVNQIRAILLRIFSKSISSRNMIEYKNEAKVIMNEVGDQKNTYKMPRCTLNDMEEILFTDDLEDGIIQRRSEKWTCLPERQKPIYVEDGFCEFRNLNVPMSMMTYEDDEMDRLSMPSTRTGVTTLTTEDQMAAIQNQLAMLSKQLMSLQKTGVEAKRGSSRASSRRGARKMDKKSSIEISSDSSSSVTSEDEGKGPSVCSPSLSSNRKVSESSSSKHSSTVSVQIAPMGLAPPPPPPPPPMMMKAPLSEINMDNLKTPSRSKEKKTTANSLPPAETIVSNRPYLTDIANGRSLLKKTVRSPGGSPACQIRHQKRAVSSFEAALRDRFRGFHGDTSFSEQEENGDDDDINATWDE